MYHLTTSSLKLHLYLFQSSPDGFHWAPHDFFQSKFPGDCHLNSSNASGTFFNLGSVQYGMSVGAKICCYLNLYWLCSDRLWLPLANILPASQQPGKCVLSSSAHQTPGLQRLMAISSIQHFYYWWRFPEWQSK